MEDLHFFDPSSQERADISIAELHSMREVGPSSVAWEPMARSGNPVTSGVQSPISQGGPADLLHVPQSMLNVPVVDLSPPLYQPVSPTAPVNLPREPQIAREPLPGNPNVNILPSFNYIPPQYNDWILTNDTRNHHSHPNDITGISSVHEPNSHGQLSLAPSHPHTAFESVPIHVHALPFDDIGYRQVGSSAGTDASKARRGSRPPRYFCEFPGCNSQGFTAKHNFQCPFSHVDSSSLSCSQFTHHQITFAHTKGKGLSFVVDAELPSFLETTLSGMHERIEKSPVNITRRGLLSRAEQKPGSQLI
ncbi:hypothetical protein PM082_004954 [Marasmius tenuissimus]|nr:hypothetical protein PM082_004954 [Marasmius tenuissimus]